MKDTKTQKKHKNNSTGATETTETVATTETTATPIKAAEETQEPTVEVLQTQGVKEKLSLTMTELQEQNPMASWKNLFLGLGVVLIVVVSSLLYFNRLAANAIVSDAVTKTTPVQPAYIEKRTTSQTKGTKATQNKANTAVNKQEFTTVQEGEGLWNVAERVCKDGEKYVILAQANDLVVDEAVNTGQKLLVKCE